MKTRTFRSLRRRFVRGFTLIETLIVMVVLGIAAVTIASLTGNLFVGQAANRDMVVGTQLMQECAEKILALRRSSGFDAPALDSTSTANAYCSVTGVTTPVVTLTKGSSPSIPACPSTAADSCKLVSISQGGMTPIVLLLVDY